MVMKDPVRLVDEPFGFNKKMLEDILSRLNKILEALEWLDDSGFDFHGIDSSAIISLRDEIETIIKKMVENEETKYFVSNGLAEINYGWTFKLIQDKGEKIIGLDELDMKVYTISKSGLVEIEKEDYDEVLRLTRLMSVADYMEGYEIRYDINRILIDKYHLDPFQASEAYREKLKRAVRERDNQT